jgi:hypothetical protein
MRVSNCQTDEIKLYRRSNLKRRPPRGAPVHFSHARTSTLPGSGDHCTSNLWALPQTQNPYHLIIILMRPVKPAVMLRDRRYLT